MRKISINTIVRIIALIALIISIVWVIRDRSFDAVLAFLGSLGTLIGAFASDSLSIIGKVFSPKEDESAQQMKSREVMLKLVGDFWVEGVLRQSLHGMTMIELEKEEENKLVRTPWDVGLYLDGEGGGLIPASETIAQLFHKFNGKMLIVGEPGSGKTTTLLVLAEELINQAKTDKELSIPVVLNLASWSRKYADLKDWLISEINFRYQMPKKFITTWIERNAITLLLDGLDEVDAKSREDCVRAINSFQTEYGLIHIVVCSRATDYQNLSERVHLHRAIRIQPLSETQIDGFLRSNKRLKGLQDLIEQDHDLHEMAKSPLMLSVMMLAYSNEGAESLRLSGHSRSRRKHLFNRYVKRVFERKGMGQPFTPLQTVKWLRWISQRMIAQGQSIFQIEQIQPDWLDTKPQLFSYFILSRGISILLLFSFLLYPYWREMIIITKILLVLCLAGFFSITDYYYVHFHFSRKRSLRIAAGALIWLRGIVCLVVVYVIIPTPAAMMFALVVIGIFEWRRRKKDRVADISTFESFSFSGRNFIRSLVVINIFTSIPLLLYSFLIDRQEKMMDQIWDLDNLARPPISIDGGFKNYAESHDGKQIAILSDTGKISLFDVQGNQLRTFSGSSSSNAIFFSEQDKYINDEELNIWNLDGKKIKYGDPKLLFDAVISAVEFMPGDHGIVILYSNGIIELTDSTFKRTASFSANNNNSDTCKDFREFDLSPDGDSLYVVGGRGCPPQLWSIREQAALLLDGESEFFDVLFSPDGKLIATLDKMGEVVIWKDRNVLSRFQTQPSPWLPALIQFSPDSQYLILGFTDIEIVDENTNMSRDRSAYYPVSINGKWISGMPARVFDITKTNIYIGLWPDNYIEKIDLSAIDGARHLDKFDAPHQESLDRSYTLSAGTDYILINNRDIYEDKVIQTSAVMRLDDKLGKSEVVLEIESSSTSGDFKTGPNSIYEQNIIGLDPATTSRHGIASAYKPSLGPNGRFLYLNYGKPSNYMDSVTVWFILSLVISVLLSIGQRTVSRKLTPNFGMKLTVRNALAVSLGSLLLFTVPVLLLIFSKDTLIASLAWFAFVSIPLGLIYGGFDALRHYSLRFVLFTTGQLPWNIEKLLNHTTRHVLTRRVGSGYILIHRLILEYFSSMTDEEILVYNTESSYQPNDH
jgi:WD40 repeat protein